MIPIDKGYAYDDSCLQCGELERHDQECILEHELKLPRPEPSVEAASKDDECSCCNNTARGGLTLKTLNNTIIPLCRGCVSMVRRFPCG